MTTFLKGVSFDITPEEGVLVDIIVRRAKKLFTNYDEHDMRADIIACHCNGCPLDLEGLASSRDWVFEYDIDAIWHGISRSGKMMGSYKPISALPRKEEAAA